MARAPDAPCTAAEPCGTDWVGLGFAAALPLTLYWVVRQPRLALAGLAVVLLGHLVDGGFAAALEDPSWSAFVGAVAFAAAGLLHRLAVAARQRALAYGAAGPSLHPVPAAALAFRRGRLSFALASLLLAAAVFGYWQAQRIADAYERRSAGLVPVTGTVTASDPDGSLIGVSVGGRVHRVETAHPEEHPVGSGIELVVDGDWARSAAEPYDVSGWEVLVLAGLVGGLAFLANGVDGRTRSRRLRRGPLPVLRVLVREDPDNGRTWVYAADDLAAERPVLHFHSLPAFEEDPRTGASRGGRRGRRRARRGAAQGRRRPEGRGPAAPAARGRPVRPAVHRCRTRLRRARRGRGRRGLRGVQRQRRAADRWGPPRRPAGPRSRGGPVRTARPRTAARRRGRRRPGAVRRAPDVGRARVSRAVGVFLLLVQGGGVWALLDDEVTWHSVFPLIGLFFVTTSASTALNWRLTADRDGLWVAGAWRVRRVLWDDVLAVRHNRSGDLVVAREGDTEVVLSPSAGRGWSGGWAASRTGRASPTRPTRCCAGPRCGPRRRPARGSRACRRGRSSPSARRCGRRRCSCCSDTAPGAPPTAGPLTPYGPGATGRPG